MGKRKTVAVLAAVVMAVGVAGCDTKLEDSDGTRIECEYVTMTRPMRIGEQMYLMPYQECIPVMVDKEAK